jgi:hypothetical protein
MNVLRYEEIRYGTPERYDKARLQRMMCKVQINNDVLMKESDKTGARIVIARQRATFSRVSFAHATRNIVIADEARSSGAPRLAPCSLIVTYR